MARYGRPYTFIHGRRALPYPAPIRLLRLKPPGFKKRESFSERDESKCQWAQFSGDERALNYDDKKYGTEIPTPVEEEMVDQAEKNSRFHWQEP